jgi:hypothetical protein
MIQRRRRAPSWPTQLERGCEPVKFPAQLADAIVAPSRMHAVGEENVDRLDVRVDPDADAGEAEVPVRTRREGKPGRAAPVRKALRRRVRSTDASTTP